jgi:cyclophilin family peptidyl-prolyl cis-trans isomerase
MFHTLVAQIYNLLYRRIRFCGPPTIRARSNVATLDRSQRSDTAECNMAKRHAGNASHGNRCAMIYGLLLMTSLSPVRAGTLAQFRTPLGDIEVELFDTEKPVTVQNFLRYVTNGLYSKMFIHRWSPGFVIQGGGYYAAKQAGDDVIVSVPVFERITNEYSVGRRFSNTYGTIAMARVGGQTNSATSQWFFNLADNVRLDSDDGGFTVFGKVLRGTNVLNRFNSTSRSNGLYQLQLDPPLSELPVLSATNATFQDLLYVDISLLNLKIAPNGNGGRELAWMSVSNKLNHLEFTTNFPPAWRILLSTNGTGGNLRVTDSSPDSQRRFYRVRVDY